MYEERYRYNSRLYNFLQPSQINGMTLKYFGIPNICGEVSRHFLSSHSDLDKLLKNAKKRQNKRTAEKKGEFHRTFQNFVPEFGFDKEQEGAREEEFMAECSTLTQQSDDSDDWMSSSVSTKLQPDDDSPKRTAENGMNPPKIFPSFSYRQHQESQKTLPMRNQHLPKSVTQDTHNNHSFNNVSEKTTNKQKARGRVLKTLYSSPQSIDSVSEVETVSKTCNQCSEFDSAQTQASSSTLLTEDEGLHKYRRQLRKIGGQQNHTSQNQEFQKPLHPAPIKRKSSIKINAKRGDHLELFATNSSTGHNILTEKFDKNKLVVDKKVVTTNFRKTVHFQEDTFEPKAEETMYDLSRIQIKETGKIHQQFKNKDENIQPQMRKIVQNIPPSTENTDFNKKALNTDLKGNCLKQSANNREFNDWATITTEKDSSDASNSSSEDVNKVDKTIQLPQFGIDILSDLQTTKTNSQNIKYSATSEANEQCNLNFTAPQDHSSTVESQNSQECYEKRQAPKFDGAMAGIARGNETSSIVMSETNDDMALDLNYDVNLPRGQATYILESDDREMTRNMPISISDYKVADTVKNNKTGSNVMSESSDDMQSDSSYNINIIPRTNGRIVSESSSSSSPATDSSSSLDSSTIIDTSQNMVAKCDNKNGNTTSVQTEQLDSQHVLGGVDQYTVTFQILDAKNEDHRPLEEDSTFKRDDSRLENALIPDMQRQELTLHDPFEAERVKRRPTEEKSPTSTSSSDSSLIVTKFKALEPPSNLYETQSKLVSESDELSDPDQIISSSSEGSTIKLMSDDSRSLTFEEGIIPRPLSEKSTLLRATNLPSNFPKTRDFSIFQQGPPNLPSFPEQDVKNCSSIRNLTKPKAPEEQTESDGSQTKSVSTSNQSCTLEQSVTNEGRDINLQRDTIQSTASSTDITFKGKPGERTPRHGLIGYSSSDSEESDIGNISFMTAKQSRGADLKMKTSSLQVDRSKFKDSLDSMSSENIITDFSLNESSSDYQTPKCKFEFENVHDLTVPQNRSVKRKGASFSSTTSSEQILSNFSLLQRATSTPDQTPRGQKTSEDINDQIPPSSILNSLNKMLGVESASPMSKKKNVDRNGTHLAGFESTLSPIVSEKSFFKSLGAATDFEDFDNVINSQISQEALNSHHSERSAQINQTVQQNKKKFEVLSPETESSSSSKGSENGHYSSTTLVESEQRTFDASEKDASSDDRESILSFVPSIIDQARVSKLQQTAEQIDPFEKFHEKNYQKLKMDAFKEHRDEDNVRNNFEMLSLETESSSSSEGSENGHYSSTTLVESEQRTFDASEKDASSDDRESILSFVPSIIDQARVSKLQQTAEQIDPFEKFLEKNYQKLKMDAFEEHRDEDNVIKLYENLQKGFSSEYTNLTANLPTHNIQEEEGNSPFSSSDSTETKQFKRRKYSTNENKNNDGQYKSIKKNSHRHPMDCEPAGTSKIVKEKDSDELVFADVKSPIDTSNSTSTGSSNNQDIISREHFKEMKNVFSNKDAITKLYEKEKTRHYSGSSSSLKNSQSLSSLTFSDESTIQKRKRVRRRPLRERNTSFKRVDTSSGTD
ncbi:unnamed protein product [Bemisia tabaci]|uniref:Uncharacterized protein n=1 Tax=Bemisia tabaci TaxID=7038 RepID=A0A9P0G0V0_BEMTA|nr:unnamed protein product [Bemisia tabaci]